MNIIQLPSGLFINLDTIVMFEEIRGIGERSHSLFGRVKNTLEGESAIVLHVNADLDESVLINGEDSKEVRAWLDQFRR